ncbi:AAA family ATPase [Winogradskyella psychrotolerans]|uniref:AAA family ATPase n=1 Tax=Winogradskyella psychrotolerans TaxID=1344585 RepID=UPI001C06D807|nr:AAA family ATPase [Winogradskyella psychrotolerans]MBU2929439.1 ATP-binding protein [Winogradskyella psychrotolerans]
MRLAAVYLPKDVLPHLFGENHKGLTLNFGGINNYDIIENSEAIEVRVASVNENFIPNFWGEGISNISAIVGRNGIGKTSILRALHSIGDKKKKDVFYLFEETEESWYYYNELKNKNVTAEFEIKKINSEALSSVRQYYTPIVDIEQINALSQLGIVSTGEENLGQLYNKQLLQDVILLNDPVKNTLKTVYPDFPEYTELAIKITQHRKFDFKNVYATANLGSQDRVTVLKTYIESDLRDLEEGKWKGLIGSDFIKGNILERYINIINSSGLNSMFDQLWAQKKYSHDDGNDKLHGASDFMQNFEVTLFTYFILDATFPQTPFQGTTGNFQSIIDKDSFEAIFDAFFDLYMLSIYGIVRDEIESKLERVSIKDYHKIKEIINDDRHKKWTQSGFKSSDAVELMLRYLDRFKAFFDLYTYLNKLISENKFEIKEDSLIYKLENHNKKDFYDLIDLYNKVLSEANNFVYTLDLLTIRSVYPLSSGEKALLNFFARINNRINKQNSSNHPTFNYYLLLLDEPELGYHPVWKRKFIDAITKSIPVLFSKLNPNRNLFDTESKEFSDLKTQIIFTTHDPLTLSDIPIDNVTFIDRNADTNKSFIVNHNEDIDLATFGANVHDLLAHSFFLENGFMGEFAEGLITDLINYLTYDKDDNISESNQRPKKEWDNQLAEKVINIIDEPLIKERVQSLYNKKVLYYDKELLRLKIKQLNNQLKKLDNEED